MCKFKITAEHLIEANTVEEAKKVFANSGCRNSCLIKIENISTSKQPMAPKKLWFMSEEICGFCDNVFETTSALCNCPECNAFMPACNACVGSTDGGSCIGCFEGSLFKENANVVISYCIKKGIIKYRTNLGSGGSESNKSIEEFKTYWNLYYEGARVTYEEL